MPQIIDDWPFGAADLEMVPTIHMISCAEPDLAQAVPLPEFVSERNFREPKKLFGVFVIFFFEAYRLQSQHR